MNKNRIVFIDNLRAFSLLGVILIHILSFHLTNYFNVLLWNFLQFVVIAFVFCSGVVTAHYQTKLTSVSTVIPWYTKRLQRLYIPFFVYFIIHFLLFLLFSSIFTHFGLQKNTRFFFSSILLFGGTNTNWLPLVFIELSIITPLLFFLQKRKILWIFALLLVAMTTWFTLIPFPYAFYRYIMWIPWSLVLLTGLSYFRQTPRIKIIFTLVNFVIFIGIFFFFLNFHRSLLFYDNKYPPTFYYLSFGIFCTVLSSVILSSICFPAIIQKPLSVISKNSYALFFIHYIVLDFFESTFLSKYLVMEFVVVSLMSILVLFTLSYLRNVVSFVYFFSAKTTVRSE